MYLPLRPHPRKKVITEQMATEKICSKCVETRDDHHAFCPICGTKLTVQPKGALPIEYRNTYNTWHVTTEGDEEGRTIRDLGNHRGQIDEIAKSLSHLACYKLSFSPVKVSAALQEGTGRKSVMIELNDSSLSGMKPPERVKIMQKYLQNRPVVVKESNYYGAVELVFANPVSSHGSGQDYK